MVKINSGPVDASDKFDLTSRDKWGLLLIAKKSFLATRLAYDCRCLIEFCEEAELVYAELGFKSAAEMIREGYELDPSQVELAVAWLKHNQPKQEIGLEAITKTADKIRQLKDENPNWTQQKIAEEVGCTQGYVARVITKMSESDKTVIPSILQSRTDQADYRKLPQELQQKVVAKEVSLNAAAIQAGIRKKPTPEEQCVKAFRKCDSRLVPLKVIVESLEPHERAVVMDWLKEPTDGR